MTATAHFTTRAPEILLVEDNPADARFIEDALAGQVPRFELVHVGRLAEGCARVSREPFVAMLLDLTLPDCTGLETVRRARAAANGIPIVVLTGLGDESIAVSALAEGAQDYLVKGGPDPGVVVSKALRYAIERSRLETLREASRLEAIGQLAGGIADQFSNALASVLGYSELLLTRWDPDRPDRDILEKIAQRASRAGELTSQLLAVGRRQGRVPARLDLNQAIESMTGKLRDIAGPGIQLACRYGEVSPIVFDLAQLEYVVETLTICARDEMPDGGRLTLETAEVRLNVQPNSPFVLLTITDSSQSLGEMRHVRALQPFHNLAEFPARRRSGLELPSVPGVMAQSGGHIEMVPCGCGGNHFCLYFPIARETSH